MAESQTNYCPRDPHVETNLRCGRCGELICPECLVQTDVGSRCPSCANVRTPPMFRASGEELTRSAMAAFGASIALSVGALVIAVVFPIPFFGVVVVGGIGWLTGEIVYRVSGYKQSRALQWVAGIAVLIAFLMLSGFDPVGTFIGLIIGTYYAIQKLKPPRGV